MSDVEFPVSVLPSEEVSNSVDRVVSGVSDVEFPDSVVLSEEVSISVERVVSGVSDVELPKFEDEGSNVIAVEAGVAE